MRKEIIALTSVLLMLVVGATFIDVSSESDADSADGVWEVSDADSLVTAFASATSGNTIRFTRTVSFTEISDVPEGLTITSTVDASNQGIIVVKEVTSDDKTYFGAFMNLSEIKSALSVDGEDIVELFCAPDSYLVANGNHTNLVLKDLIVHGNGSILVKSIASKGEEVTFAIQDPSNTNGTQPLNYPADVSMTFNDLKNLKVWGMRTCNMNLTLNINNCDSISEDGVKNSGLVMLNGGNFQGSTKTVLNITGCELEKNNIGNVAIYVSTACDVDISNCSFDEIPIAINLNPKSGTHGSNISISDCVFNNCGHITDSSKFYGSTIRLSNAVQAPTMTEVSIDRCTFTNDIEHPTTNGNILVGDGRSNYQTYDMNVVIKNTAAEVQYMKPGFFSNPQTQPGGITIYDTGDENQMRVNNVDSDKILESTGWDAIISDAPIEGPDIPSTPENGDDDEDDYPFFPGTGNNSNSQSSDSNKTTLVASAAAVVVIMLAVVALMMTRNN